MMEETGKTSDIKVGCVVAVLIILALSALLIREMRTTPLAPERIEHVERVFMHERYHYSIYVKGPGQELTVRDFERSEVKIFEDVPKKEDMWVIATGHRGGGGNMQSEITYDQLEIHLHSAKDVTGAGWNHGKFGSGQTQVVE